MLDPRRSFTVGALAIADEAANAVGAVRLTCTPEGLEVELCRAATYAFGFAPAAVAEEVSFCVPYTAVRGLARKGKALGLALDPAVATPYSRFFLVRFSDDPREALLDAYASRTRARLASRLLPLPAGLLAAAYAPDSLVSGPIGTASLAALVALAVWLVLREIVGWITWGGPVSDRYSSALEQELSRRLGLVPAAVSVTGLVEPDPDPAPTPDRGADPRLRAVVAISLATLGAIGVIAFLKEFAGEPEATAPPASRLERRVGPAVAGVHLGPSDLGRSAPRCLCARADSPLWKDGVPALSFLASSRGDGSSDILPTLDGAGKSRYDFDLAVVNNSARPVSDVKAVVTFARRDEAGARTGIKERGLFWEGELASGRAVKWRIRAPGTEMRIDADPRGMIGADGSEPAPADVFFELARQARYRVVRIHAAMMLAYLGDPRAGEVAQSLGGGGGASDERTVDRIRRATRPLFACDLGTGTSACIFNASSRPRGKVSISEVAEDGAVGKPSPIDVLLPVHEGVRVEIEPRTAPRTELVVTEDTAP